MGTATLRQRLHGWLNGHNAESSIARVVGAFLILTIALGVIAGMALTLRDLTPRAEFGWTVAIAAVQVVFLVEYLLRVWTASGDKRNAAGSSWRCMLCATT